MTNYCMFKRMVLSDPVSYDEAIILLDKANKSPCADYLNFIIVSHSFNTWQLEASPIELQKVFLRHPEDFILEVD